jgi:lipoprotein NlpD
MGNAMRLDAPKTPHVIVLMMVASLGGCAGWSSWEDERERPAVALQNQTAVKDGEYRVQRGDTVYSIAFRNNVDFRQLAAWNKIGSEYLIYPGQVLRLTQPAPEKRISGEIESIGIADVNIGKPRPVTPNSAPPTQAQMPSVQEYDELPPAVAGDYAWVWPAEGSLLRNFAQSSNRGLDIGGRSGQPIFAAAPGRVVYSGNALKGYGELIIIKHDEVYLSAYGYNRSRHVKEGDFVTAGQPIAEMGRGPENKPLLHFEIRKSGKPIDPASKLVGSTAAVN